MTRRGAGMSRPQELCLGVALDPDEAAWMSPASVVA